MNRIEEIYRQSPQPAAFAKGYLSYLGEILAKVNADEVAAVADAFLEAREKGSRIYFIGNGGSAATAMHFANDIAIGTRTPEKPFRAISLSDNNAILTAIGNDFGYEDVFERQLRNLLTPEDLVVAISASGNSPNIVKAIEYSNSVGAITIGLTGFDGGKLRTMVKLPLHVPSNAGEYGPVEDLHMIFDHLLGAYLYYRCRELR